MLRESDPCRGRDPPQRGSGLPIPLRGGTMPPSALRARARGSTRAPFVRFVPLAAFILVPLAAAAQSSPPPAPVREVSESYFGTTVVDPYRWMEETSNPEVVSWIKAQNDYCRTALAALPAREALKKRIQELDNASISIGGLQLRGGRAFYYKVEPGSDNRKLCVRKGLDGPERVLVDPEKLSAVGQH